MNMTSEIKQKIETNLNGIVAVTLDNFLSLDLPPRECLMKPWLPCSGIVQVYAYRGVGKTFFALNIAYSVATGSSFIGWQCPMPKRVLYIDGEMPASDMQERLKAIQNGGAPTGENFKLITPDLQDIVTPNLANSESQTELENYTNDADLIVVDNISTLCRTGKENDSDNWTPVQRWALKMRSEGRTVMFIHHANKNGGQRGTSGREDVLDTVIALKQASGSSPTEGANFEVHFEKNRGFAGKDAQAFNARLDSDSNEHKWVRESLVDSSFNRCVELANKGSTQAEVARILGINKSNVSRHFNKAKEQGLIKEQEP